MRTIRSRGLSVSRLVALLVIVSTMSACGALHTAVKKSDLDVQTKMSETIFLEPVSPSKRIVFVDVRNTSDKDFDIEDAVMEKIRANGYQLTDDPEQANYMLLANVLQVGKADLRSADSAVTSGFGGALLGAAIGGMNSSDDKGAIVAGVIGAAATVVGDALVDDVLYTMITDIQVRERPVKNEVIVETQESDSAIGTSTKVQQTVSGAEVKWKTYRTRVVSTANKTNLEFDEAIQPLQFGLIRSIGGIF